MFYVFGCYSGEYGQRAERLVGSHESRESLEEHMSRLHSHGSECYETCEAESEDSAWGEMENRGWRIGGGE